MSGSKLSPSITSRDLVLHIWPKYDSVLSFDVASSAVLLYLQLALPGQFSVAYSANPKLPPAGQLPFLTQGIDHASGLGPIVSYLQKLHHAHNLDAGLNSVHAAQLAEHIAHVQANYGDLVNHMLYALKDNWARVTKPALVSMLPVPQRYTVPARIRESHKVRLQEVDLWDVPEESEEEEKDEEEEKHHRIVSRKRRKKKSGTNAGPLQFKQAFGREKVVEKAKALFNLYDRLLGSHRFFNGRETPTTLDVVFAAHTHMLLDLRLPDPPVTTTLESYPRLVVHCRAVLSSAFSPGVPLPPTIQRSKLSSLRRLVPWPKSPKKHKLRRTVSTPETSTEAQQAGQRYREWMLWIRI
ncbi:Tom37 C-terminal domain-containing protein [Lenzites betulinus]|nr:Tom37 C-terminal domain-containing protein [Lenzites betulinus]